MPGPTASIEPGTWPWSAHRRAACTRSGSRMVRQPPSPASDLLGRPEAEGFDISERTRHDLAGSRAEGVGAIGDEGDPVTVGQRPQECHRGEAAGQVDGEDGTCSRRDRCGDRRWVDHPPLVDVDRDWDHPGPADGLPAGQVRVARQDHLTAPVGDQRQGGDEAVRAVRYSHHIVITEPWAQLGLEPPDVRALAQAAGFDDQAGVVEESLDIGDGGKVERDRPKTDSGQRSQVLSITRRNPSP